MIITSCEGNIFGGVLHELKILNMTFCGRQLQKYVEKCATKELATADERSRRCREPWGAIVSGRGCCCGGHIAISNSLLVDNISATERTIIIPYRTYGGERASK